MSPRVYPFSKMAVKWRNLTLLISYLFPLGKNYTIVREIIILKCSYAIKIKLSHGISRIYLHWRPIRAIETSKIYIPKVKKQSWNGQSIQISCIIIKIDKNIIYMGFKMALITMCGVNWGKGYSTLLASSFIDFNTDS